MDIYRLEEHDVKLEATDKQLEVRGYIENLEESLREEIQNGELIETVHDASTDEGSEQCNHYFGDGIYLRSLVIPGGTLVIGRVHKQARICVVASGKCTFLDEFRKQTVTAPWVGEFEAGSKTAVFAHQTTLWLACLGTDRKDPQDIVTKLTALSHKEILEG